MDNHATNHRVQVTLSPSESRRLVAKGVANLEAIKKALKQGIIILSRSTTNAYVYEELTGKKIRPDGYCCGVITTFGACISKYVFDRLYQTIILVDGKPVQLTAPQELSEYINKMGTNDVFIKSANTLDPFGVAATLVGEPSGGEIGHLKSILAKQAKLIVPVTINKTVPVSIETIRKECSIEGTERAMGMPLTLLPLPGLTITELDVIKMLSGAKATPIATLDAEGRGTTTFIISGLTEQIDNVWKLLSTIKGEASINVERLPCNLCPAGTCQNSSLKLRE